MTVMDAFSAMADRLQQTAVSSSKEAAILGRTLARMLQDESIDESVWAAFANDAGMIEAVIVALEMCTDDDPGDLLCCVTMLLSLCPVQSRATLLTRPALRSCILRNLPLNDANSCNTERCLALLRMLCGNGSPVRIPLDDDLSIVGRCLDLIPLQTDTMAIESVAPVVMLHAGMPGDIVIQAICNHKDSGDFSHALLRYWNRAPTPELDRSCLQFVCDVLRTGHAAMFYVNDVAVVVDIVLRQLTDATFNSTLLYLLLDCLWYVLHSEPYLERNHKLTETTELLHKMRSEAQTEGDSRAAHLIGAIGDRIAAVVRESTAAAP
ncbi:unnamed protein product (mitochondrion) [Plasmodiophora brassicae]|uniref:SPIN90/Ldb17 leucine-rich domain-containing protein n=1 Tax=Plasmodiophora brassicae TaxID=37360 RepID=A0A0G4IY34_PLABS|nr:hypothetical protein PBRA_007982 [Plasmodiophora brassicae]SPQ96513.1 unnamed protein product [Plasmodiophora brassicae]